MGHRLNTHVFYYEENMLISVSYHHVSLQKS